MKKLLILGMLLLPTVSYAQTPGYNYNTLSCRGESCSYDVLSMSSMIIPEELSEANNICVRHKILDEAVFATYPPSQAYHYEKGYEDCSKIEDKIAEYNAKKDIQLQKDLVVIKKALETK